MSKISRALLLSLLALYGQLSLACERDGTCLEPRQWHIAVALGAGVRTNPLVDGDLIPLVILPDFAWYGDAFYLDNDEVGYQWLPSSSLALETFVSLNKEATFFEFGHPSNFLFGDSLAGVSMIGPQEEGERTVSIDEIAKRRWAVDAGLRFHVYAQNSEWTLALKTDISGVHEGHQAELGYRYTMMLEEWTLRLAPSLVWKSESLVDYYYGLDDRDAVAPSLRYEASSGWQPGFSIAGSKPLSEDWLFLFKAAVTKLHSGMTNSPMVESDWVHTAFVGAAYTF
ncbi:MipA/OmpV family protein [Aliiglaciecola sp. CAU 1673]|uniref:MipA/OmpV family protein n=1 Tax=Aliiglaciecola sp. CAU 1673 TaxID=3032595 RepID=UPI0023DC0FB3|nr:MipA/OmpV family protein [Aliiglaciecola sp. CAU 1673]MDF2177906.1 MipA/OmpV family protein [Aliiglaciecola sp. CAU 1673]